MLRSTTGLWASSRCCGEPGIATAAGRIQEEAQTACSNAMGSTVLGQSVPGLEPLAAGADFRSARYGGPLATGTSRRFWARLSRHKGPRRGRPAVAPEVRKLVRDMAIANPLWRAPRIHGELKMLGITISERTVSRILRSIPRPPSQTWKTFLRNHLGQSYRLTSLRYRQSGCESCSCSWRWNTAAARCSTST